MSVVVNVMLSLMSVMNKLCSGIKSLKGPNSSDATQVKMSRIANIINMIMKSEILIKSDI